MSTPGPEQLNQMLRAMMRSLGDSALRDATKKEVELFSGESKGPFCVKELGADASEGENQVTLLDQVGQAHHFEFSPDDVILRRIRPCADARLANCVVLNIDSILQLVVTRDVFKGEPLLAAFLTQQIPSTNRDKETEKRFVCPSCHLAKFNCLENLTAHQQFYCQKKEEAASPLILPTLCPSSALSFPNVLLLPLAYHDQPQTDLVQLLGPPQTVVPVAVGRNAAPLTNPLILQRGLCTAVTLPSSLQYSVGGVSVSLPIVHSDSPSTSSAGLLKRVSERSSSTPLDLSRKRSKVEVVEEKSTTSPHKASSSEIEKPFVCTCGVAFSAENTLNAHKQYYCKNVERNEEHREPVKKFPLRCAQCEFEAQSHSQLSVHVRTIHNDIQAYVCKECGYRGYSLRGIRSHMRSHPHFEHLKFDALLAQHVAKVKAERSTPDSVDLPE